MESTYNQWFNRSMYANEKLAQLTELAGSILAQTETVAIVGLSKNRHKDSQHVAHYLQRQGIQIIPINPTADVILGEKAYASILDLPKSPDAISVFLPSSLIPSVIDDLLTVQPKGLWLQLGTGKQPEALQKGQSASIPVFENRCIKVDHQFLIRTSNNKNRSTK